METLVLGFFLGLIATWFSARVSKSTDTRTQLLLDIDNWVNELTEISFSTYFKYKNVKKVFYDEFVEDVRGYKTIGYTGIAKALKIDGLIQRLNRFDSGVARYINSMFNLTFMYEDEKEPHIGAQLDTIMENLDEVNRAAEEVHKIIAEERMRIFPSISNYYRRVKTWIKGKKELTDKKD